MAVYDHEEQELFARIKGWWEQYGTLVTSLVVAVAIGVVSWQGWQWYQGRQAAQASGEYFSLQQAIERGDVASVRDSAGALIEQYPRTFYAQMGALKSAAAQFEQGDARNAQAHLEWLAENGTDAAMRDIARLRLAAILLDEGEYDQALAQLDDAPVQALVARFEDVRGDILNARGNVDRAREAYERALNVLMMSDSQNAQALREVVTIKLDSLETT